MNLTNNLLGLNTCNDTPLLDIGSHGVNTDVQPDQGFYEILNVILNPQYSVSNDKDHTTPKNPTGCISFPLSDNPHQGDMMLSGDSLPIDERIVDTIEDNSLYLLNTPVSRLNKTSHHVLEYDVDTVKKSLLSLHDNIKDSIHNLYLEEPNVNHMAIHNALLIIDSHIAKMLSLMDHLEHLTIDDASPSHPLTLQEQNLLSPYDSMSILRKEVSLLRDNLLTIGMEVNNTGGNQAEHLDNTQSLDVEHLITHIDSLHHLLNTYHEYLSFFGVKDYPLATQEITKQQALEMSHYLYDVDDVKHRNHADQMIDQRGKENAQGGLVFVGGINGVELNDSYQDARISDRISALHSRERVLVNDVFSHPQRQESDQSRTLNLLSLMDRERVSTTVDNQATHDAKELNGLTVKDTIGFIHRESALNALYRPRESVSLAHQSVADRAIMMVQQGPRLADIHLNLPELGHLKVRIKVEGNDTVSLVFYSTSQTVREQLEQQMVRLKEMLESQGLFLSDGHVSEDGSSDSSNKKLCFEDKNNDNHDFIDKTDIKYEKSMIKINKIDYFV